MGTGTTPGGSGDVVTTSPGGTVVVGTAVDAVTEGALDTDDAGTGDSNQGDGCA
ncbi:hypothetical protein ABZ816_09780 [Actinosynnema sp. NPDC047251]